MTQCDRILNALADNEWHTSRDLYHQAGGFIGALHSRIAELRRRGHTILHDTVKGETGAGAHRYRLVGPYTPSTPPEPVFPTDAHGQMRLVAA